MNELQKIEPLPSPVATNVEAMITLAIERSVPVETIERLMVIRREVRAEQAKEAFDRALAAFQAECPTIRKTAKVMNKDGRSVRYQYAPLDAIISQVKELLQRHGFSYTVNAEAKPTAVKATCKLTHSYGHSESSEFEVPIDKDAYMNPAQQVASALTFAKRYSFCNAAGIMTGDADDDSQASFTDKGQPKAKEPIKPAAKPTPANPSTAKPAGAATPSATPATATEEQKARWLALLKPLGQAAVFYAREKGWIMPPTDEDDPGEPLEAMSLTWVPTSKRHASEILAEIQAGMDGASTAQSELDSIDADLPLGQSGLEDPQEPAPDDGVETITGKLEAVSEKDGRSAKGPWKRYGLKIGSEWYGTFDKVLGELAKKDKGHAVRIQFKRDERGCNLISIERPPKAS